MASNNKRVLSDVDSNSGAPASKIAKVASSLLGYLGFKKPEAPLPNAEDNIASNKRFQSYVQSPEISIIKSSLHSQLHSANKVQDDRNTTANSTLRIITDYLERIQEENSKLQENLKTPLKNNIDSVNGSLSKEKKRKPSISNEQFESHDQQIITLGDSQKIDSKQVDKASAPLNNERSTRKSNIPNGSGKQQSSGTPYEKRKAPKRQPIYIDSIERSLLVKLKERMEIEQYYQKRYKDLKRHRKNTYLSKDRPLKSLELQNHNQYSASEPSPHTTKKELVITNHEGAFNGGNFSYEDEPLVEDEVKPIVTKPLSEKIKFTSKRESNFGPKPISANLDKVLNTTKAKIPDSPIERKPTESVATSATSAFSSTLKNSNIVAPSSGFAFQPKKDVSDGKEEVAGDVGLSLKRTSEPPKFNGFDAGAKLGFSSVTPSVPALFGSGNGTAAPATISLEKKPFEFKSNASKDEPIKRKRSGETEDEPPVSKNTFNFGKSEAPKLFSLDKTAADKSTTFNFSSESKSSEKAPISTSNDSATSKPATGFSFGGTVAKPSAEIKATSTVPSFDFKTVPATNESDSKIDSKPVTTFSFTAPSSQDDIKKPAAPFQFGGTKTDSSTKPVLTFGMPSKSTEASTPALNASKDKEDTTKTLFNFGGDKKEQDEAAVQPLFGSIPEQKEEPAKLAFSFSAEKKDEPAKPAFVFGAEKKVESTKPSFTFDSKKKDESSKPSFSFSTEKKDEPPKLSFAFGGEKKDQTPKSTFNFGPTSAPSAPSVAAPTPSVPVFGAPTVVTESKPADKPSFNFGATSLPTGFASAPVQSQTTPPIFGGITPTSRPASAFGGSNAPAAVGFQFNREAANTDTSKPFAPSFNNPSSQSAPIFNTDAKAAFAGFSSGANGSASTSAFNFGAGSQQNSLSNSSSRNATPGFQTPVPQAKSFGFGNTALPSLSGISNSNQNGFGGSGSFNGFNAAPVPAQPSAFGGAPNAGAFGGAPTNSAFGGTPSVGAFGGGNNQGFNFNASQTPPFTGPSSGNASGIFGNANAGNIMLSNPGSTPSGAAGAPRKKAFPRPIRRS